MLMLLLALSFETSLSSLLSTYKIDNSPCLAKRVEDIEVILLLSSLLIEADEIMAWNVKQGHDEHWN